jgi:hypothetical protein
MELPVVPSKWGCHCQIPFSKNPPFTGGLGGRICNPRQHWGMVGREGLEPSTNGLRVRCSTN